MLDKKFEKSRESSELKEQRSVLGIVESLYWGIRNSSNSLNKLVCAGSDLGMVTSILGSREAWATSGDRTRIPTLSFHIGALLVSYTQERPFVLHREQFGCASSHYLS